MFELWDRKTRLSHHSMPVGHFACGIVNEDGQSIEDHSKIMTVREGPINEMSCEHANFVCHCEWNSK